MLGPGYGRRTEDGERVRTIGREGRSRDPEGALEPPIFSSPLGAVAQGPDASWFFKLAGPGATVATQRAAFDELTGSLKRGG
jgi:hypothetical protein